MKNIVLLGASRTPVGSFLGKLSSLPASALGAAAIRGALAQAAVPADRIEAVVLGNVLQAGQGQAPARQASLAAGIPSSVPCVTVHKVCGSGMRAAMDVGNAIIAGEYDLAIGGGMESMSNAPYLLDRARTGYRMGNGVLVDSMIKDGLWDPYKDVHMGNCAEMCVAKYSLSREEQDAFSLRSYQRAQDASKRGLFADEIVSVEVPQKKGPPVVVDTDEEPFAAPLDRMAGLKPAFQKEGGTVTAANSSKINDGAAAMVIASAEKSRELGAKPLARIVDWCGVAQDPEWFTTAPIGAIEKL
ncbi:MAG: acetyl-CoA C-acyltransferase, partial [Acidobacteriota bacterium]|nr:acetyl-CoA C-acyltransferase [Acidobacteriota bacterium]